MSSIKIAVIGLGESGEPLAAKLQAAGASVVGFDPAKPKRSHVPAAESIAEAVADADVVISVDSAAASVRTAQQAAAAMKPGAIFADLNNGTPALKRRIAGLLPAEGFADLATLSTGSETEGADSYEVSGPAAKTLIQLLEPLGINLAHVSDAPGDAAARNLIRGLLAKGMASVMVDTLWAAQSVGMQDWAIQHLKDQFTASSEATLQNYLDDTGKYAKRRSVEMNDVQELLTEAGYDSTMVSGMGLTFSHVMHGRKVPFADLSDD